MSNSRENIDSNDTTSHIHHFTDSKYYMDKWKKWDHPWIFAGFNLSAGILGPLWLSYRRMNLVLFIYFITILVLQCFFVLFNIEYSYLIPIVIHIILFTFGNSIYFNFVKKKMKKMSKQNKYSDFATNLRKAGGISKNGVVVSFFILFTFVWIALSTTSLITSYKAAVQKENSTLFYLEILEENNNKLYDLGVETIDLIIGVDSPQQKINSIMNLEQTIIEYKEQMTIQLEHEILLDELIFEEANDHYISGLNNVLLSINNYLDGNEANNEQIVQNLTQVLIHGDFMYEKIKQFQNERSIEMLNKALNSKLKNKLKSIENVKVVNEKAILELNNKLLDAIENNNIEEVKQLLILGANPNDNSNTIFKSVPFLAVEKGNYMIFKTLINAGMDVNTVIQDGHLTLLMHASSLGHDQIVNQLINYNVNLKQKDRNGSTALHYIVSTDFEIATTLINAGLDPEEENNHAESYIKKLENKIRTSGGFTDFIKHINPKGLHLLNLIGIERFEKIEVPKETEQTQSGWQTYTNQRFGFIVKFPSDWKIGEAPTNGDGLSLNTDPSNHVSAYAGYHFPMNLDSFLDFRLKNGDTAKIIIEQTTSNNIVFHMIYTNNQIDYNIRGEVTVTFFEKYLNQIEEMIYNFETFKGAEG
ncbi:ankyrin repeat domain-containing protein [Chengkuizengella axinellae]|uniref:Ankyrin repeat domain-containing protein n=1 Tax=Chengkuizengella axinellae TaxID=3064388 RepID=A0ABT9J3E7_9BACL|nr:ankyrin repeat domain-containing protein [Chengkuizengella sp. 2205SS18-9]MDP5275519.1 ankyrin repeat domain-containing protein [Chengkuizengella sp. 2205SS18-9]